MMPASNVSSNPADELRGTEKRQIPDPAAGRPHKHGGYRWTKLWVGILTLLGVQVVATDIGFFFYAFSNAWKLPADVVIVWLAAMAVQIVILTLVLARREW